MFQHINFFHLNQTCHETPKPVLKTHQNLQGNNKLLMQVKQLKIFLGNVDSLLIIQFLEEYLLFRAMNDRPFCLSFLNREFVKPLHFHLCLL